MLNWFNKSQSTKNPIFCWFKNQKKALIILYSTFGFYFTYVFFKMFQFKDSGIQIGHPNAWSDWALHISITNIFASKPPSEWFLYHPYYANGKLTYGFLVHLFTGLIMKTGLRIDVAFFIVSFVLLILFLLGLYALYFKLSNSKKESLLAIFILFTSSGMGIHRYLSVLSISDLLHPRQDFTRFLEYDWLAGNIPSAMLIPQRAFFIGMTMGIWVILSLLIALDLEKKYLKYQKKLLITSGLLAGLLPIAHMHSFITIVVVTATIIFSKIIQTKKIKENIKLALCFVLPATILSNILFFKFIFGGIEIYPFMTISLGWTNSGNILDWFMMWFKLWGTFLPILIYACYYLKLNKDFREKNLLITSLGFGLLFLIANIIIFQPTTWDNTKIFAWVYLGFSIVVAKFLNTIWKRKTILKIVVITLIFTLSFTGSIELIRLANFKRNTNLLLNSSDMKFAEEIKLNTKTDSIFLTGMTHNHPITMWASRPMFLGYLGWVRNFGFDHTKREKITYAIYHGDPGANQLIIDNKISYIYVGNQEKIALKPNWNFLRIFPIAFQNKDTVVFDTRDLWQQ